MTDDDGERSPIYGSLARGGQFYRRPGARLSAPQDDSVVSLSSGLPEGYHEGFHAFDKAHAVMLTEEGLVPPEKGAAILRGLREMEGDGDEHVAVRQESGRGAHAGEAYLIQEYGEDVGGWLHLARSSHDLGATATRAMIRERLLDAMAASLDLMEAYADRAEEHAADPIPTYTGLQHAQVATIGFCLLGFERPLERDFERMSVAYDRVNTSPAGAAVGTTSDVPIDRQRTAELLGFDGVLDNAEDVDKSVDVILETGSAAATTATSVAAAADRFLIWYSKEFDVVDLPDRFCGTSSIMPQKKNPHAIESVQRDTNDVIGAATEAFAATKNVGGGVGISPSVLDTLVDNLETWAALVSDISFDTDRAESLVYRDWALATDLATAMVQEADVPWRTAHQITAVLVRHAHEQGFGVRDLTPAHVDAAAEEYLGEPLGLSESTLATVLDASRAIEARAPVAGSPAPERVREQAAATREFVADGRELVAERREALAAAEERLADAVESVLASASDST